MSVAESIVVAEAPETKLDTKPLRLSGSQPFTQQPNVFIMIGERTNVAGSPRFAKLVKEGKFEEAVSVAGSKWRMAPTLSTYAWTRA